MNGSDFKINEALLEAGSLRYLTAGEGDEVAVVLQGWATEYKVYSLIISELMKKYRVIFPLLPGFGGEKEPPLAMSVSDYAILVDALLRHLDVREADFFCHSYGGRVFFKLSASGSFFTRPRRVVLCDVAGIMPKRSLGYKIRVKLFKFTRKLLSTAVMRFLYPILLDELAEVVSDNDGDDLVDLIALRDSLNRFLRSLKADARRVFLKRYWYMQSIFEIAKSLSMSESRVKSLLMRTREKLKIHLTKEGFAI